MWIFWKFVKRLDYGLFGIISNDFPIKQLAKTFILFYFFYSKAKSKDLADFMKTH